MSDVNVSKAPNSFANFKKVRYNERNNYKIKSHLETIKYFISAFRPSDVIMLGRDEIIEYGGLTAGTTIGILSAIFLTDLTATTTAQAWWIGPVVTGGVFTPLGILITIVCLILIGISLYQLLKDVAYPSQFADIHNRYDVSPTTSSFLPLYNTPSSSQTGTFKHREHVVVYLLNDAETYADDNFTYNSTEEMYSISDQLYVRKEIKNRDNYNYGGPGYVDMNRMLALKKGSLAINNGTYYIGNYIAGGNEYGNDKVTNELFSTHGYKLFMSFHLPELTPYIKIKNVSLTGQYSGRTDSTTQASASPPAIEVAVEDFRFHAGLKTSWIYNSNSVRHMVVQSMYDGISSSVDGTVVPITENHPLHDSFNFYNYYTGYTSLSHNSVPEIYDSDVEMVNPSIQAITDYPSWIGRMEASGSTLTLNQDDYLNGYEYRKRHISDHKIPTHGSITGYDNMLKLALGGVAASSEYGIKRLKFAFGINPLLAYDDSNFVNNYDNDSSPSKWYKNGPYWTPYEARISRYTLYKQDIQAFRLGYEFDYAPYLEAEVTTKSYFSGNLAQQEDTLDGLTFRVTNKGSAATSGPVSIRIVSFTPPSLIQTYAIDPTDYLTFHSSSDLANASYYTGRLISNIGDDRYRLDYGSYEVIYSTSATLVADGGEWYMDGEDIPFQKTDGTNPSSGYKHIMLQVDWELEQEEHRWIQGMDAQVATINNYPAGPDTGMTDMGITELPKREVFDTEEDALLASVSAGVDDVGKYKRQNYAGTTIINVSAVTDLKVYNAAIETSGTILAGQASVEFSYNYVSLGDLNISSGSATLKHYISNQPYVHAGSQHYPTEDIINSTTLTKDSIKSHNVTLDLPDGNDELLYFIVVGTLNTSEATTTNNTSYVSFPIQVSKKKRVFFID